MRHIDWLGLPGSGKSTLRRATLRWADEVTPTLSTNAVVTRYLRHFSSDPVWKKMGRVIPSSLVSRFAQPAFVRSTDHFTGIRDFMQRYPDAIEVVLASSRRRADFEPRVDKILGWWLHLAAVYSAADELPDDPVVLFDEGFTNRAISLYGYRFGEVDEPDLHRYMRAVPRPAAVVYMATPVETCIERMDDWSVRFEDFPVEERISFMQSAQRCLDRVLEHLHEMSVPVLVVENDGVMSETERDLRGQLTPMLRDLGTTA